MPIVCTGGSDAQAQHACMMRVCIVAELALSPATPHGTGSGVATLPMYGSKSTAPSSRIPPG